MVRSRGLTPVGSSWPKRIAIDSGTSTPPWFRVPDPRKTAAGRSFGPPGSRDAGHQEPRTPHRASGAQYQGAGPRRWFESTGRHPGHPEGLPQGRSGVPGAAPAPSRPPVSTGALPAVSRERPSTDPHRRTSDRATVGVGGLRLHTFPSRWETRSRTTSPPKNHLCAGRTGPTPGFAARPRPRPPPGCLSLVAPPACCGHAQLEALRDCLSSMAPTGSVTSSPTESSTYATVTQIASLPRR